jgi:hypothetical protein
MSKPNGGGLPATTAQAETGTNNDGPLTVGEFAAMLVKKDAEAATTEEQSTEEATEATEETSEAEVQEAETAPEAEKPAESEDEGTTEEGAEQPESEPEAEETEVLSKLNPRTQEKIQKRIDKVVAEKKAAESRASELETRMKEIEAKLNEQRPAPEPEVIPISTADPDDVAAYAKSEAELAKLEHDARIILKTYADNETAVMRAIAQDRDEILIGSSAVNVSDLRDMKKRAEAHLQAHIPARRKFLTERTVAVNETRKIFPDLFDSSKPAYQELQGVLKQFPALRTVPQLEYFIGFALEGMAARRKSAETAKSAPAKAAAKPPTSAADSGANATPAKAKTAGAGERAKLKADLEKVEKEFDRTGSNESYQKTLILKNRLKQLK